MTLFPEKRTRPPGWTPAEDNALVQAVNECWEKDRILRVLQPRTWRACLRRAQIIGLEWLPTHGFAPCIEDRTWNLKRPRKGCACESCEARRAAERKPVVFRCRECGHPNTIIGGRFGETSKVVVT